MLVDTQRIQKSIRRVSKFLKKKPKVPAPQKIHDVRTSSRRLETALETLQITKKSLKKRLQRELRRLRKRCGKLRDMDVLTAEAMSLTPEESERECLVQLVEHLGARRFKNAKKLRNETKRRGPGLRADLAKLSKVMDRRVGQKVDSANIGGTKGQDTSAMSELGKPTRLDKRNLHPYRLKVKDVRYTLQFSKEMQDDQFVDSLGKVKDSIGKWHDWEELVAIAVEEIGHRPHCKLLRQMEKIAGRKFDEALAATSKMRRDYLDGKRPAPGARTGQTIPFSTVRAMSATHT
jgi:CHAD domain-containing protein